ncbi:MAG: AraC family ligand binding domain-containing protein [Tannerellaceae bacterium]|nr:AraC family ligand binding domain-containing protein [Tannerellaceae bacterium]
MSSHIPLHKISESFDGKVALIKHINGSTMLPSITYPHKDDYYVFLLIRKGTGTMMIDFQEYEIKDGAVRCILPGQVHFPVSAVQAHGWFLAVDPMFVKSDYKHLFEKVSLSETAMLLDTATMDELEHAAVAIQKRLDNSSDYIRQNILHDLLHYYVGIIAETYQKGSPIPINKSTALITFKFKTLLSANYQTVKRPAEYASQLNITPAYLNEAVKKNNRAYRERLDTV